MLKNIYWGVVWKVNKVGMGWRQAGHREGRCCAWPRGRGWDEGRYKTGHLNGASNEKEEVGERRWRTGTLEAEGLDEEQSLGGDVSLEGNDEP